MEARRSSASPQKAVRPKVTGFVLTTAGPITNGPRPTIPGGTALPEPLGSTLSEQLAELLGDTVWRAA
jgi:hypothetical protein